MDYVLSHHANEMLRRRKIPLRWLEETLRSPHRVERDTIDPAIVHHLRAVDEGGGRVLRVLYNDTVSPVRVVSVFLDRRMKGKL